MFGAIVSTVGAAFLGVLPRISDLDRVWTIVRSLSWVEVMILVALSAWNIVTYWPMLVAAMPGLSLAQAAVVCQSSTTVAMTVPGGGALAVGVSYAMYTSWGFRKSQVAMSAFATFVANMSFKLALPVLSLALLAANGDPDAGLVGTAIRENRDVRVAVATINEFRAEYGIAKSDFFPQISVAAQAVQ